MNIPTCAFVGAAVIGISMACQIGNAFASVDVMPCGDNSMSPPSLSDPNMFVPKDYPPESRAKGEYGTAFLSIIIAESGYVEDAVLAETSGYAGLDDASLAVAKTWIFGPATLDGKEVACRVFVPVYWGFEDESTQILQGRRKYSRPDHFMYGAGPMKGFHNLAAELNLDGQVVLAPLKNTRGKVVDAQVFRSSGKPALDTATAEMVKAGSFSPATFDGKRVASWGIGETVIWTLDPSGSPLPPPQNCREQPLSEPKPLAHPDPDNWVRVRGQVQIDKWGSILAAQAWMSGGWIPVTDLAEMRRTRYVPVTENGIAIRCWFAKDLLIPNQ